MIIDAHCHLGDGRYKKLDINTLLKEMDEQKIQKAVIIPVEEYITVYNEEGNEYILKAVNENRDKFAGFATVNPWYGSKGIEMLKKYLEKGLKGIKLNPSLQGFLLNDRIVYDIVEAAQSYKVPVYFHTGTPVHSMPFMLRDVAMSFPKVNFIMGHMGAYDFGNDLITSAKGMDNIYLDTSLNLSCTIKMAINNLGADKVIFGSDAPRSTQKFELEKVYTACSNKEDLDKVLGGNIMSLLEGCL